MAPPTMETSAGNPSRNPKDSMKCTWREDKSKWTTPHHWLIWIMNIENSTIGVPIPVHQKDEPVPWMGTWSQHRWILMHALWPVIVHKAYELITGQHLSPLMAFFCYMAAMQLNSSHQLRVLRRMGQKYGYFDGDKHPRDDIPDHSVAKTVNSLLLTTSIRPMLAVFLAYKASQNVHLSWWLPVEVGLYPIALDFWFYLYHRSCHELDGLWQYHRTHHLTKHPSPLLSSYADSEQEFIELALIPVLAFSVLRILGFPMPFWDWWVCHTYIIFAEAVGHSGLRIWASTASTFSFFLEKVGMELVTEDHDMHHRKGWKHSYNYGKATRVWDKLLGTCGERPEGHFENIDYNNEAIFPMF